MADLPPWQGGGAGVSQQDLTDTINALSASELADMAIEQTARESADVTLDARVSALESAQSGGTTGDWTAGPRSVVLGDSTSSAGVWTGSDLLVGMVWWNVFCARSMGAVRLIFNGADSGLTTTDILARLFTHALNATYSPDRLFLCGGNNDPVLGLSPATTKANLVSIVEQTLAYGADVVICTETPRTGGSWHPGHARVNQIIREIAETYQLALIDFNRVLSDPTTGTPKAGMTTDGTHPYTPLGVRTMVDEAVRVCQDLPWWTDGQVKLSLPYAPPELSVFTADIVSGSNVLNNVVASSGVPAPGQRLHGAGIPSGTFMVGVDLDGAGTYRISANATATTNTVTIKATDPRNVLGDPDNPTFHGLMLTDTNADGVPNGWVKTGTATFSVVDAGDLIPGNFAQIDQGASGTSTLSFTTVNFQGFVSGDKVRVTFRFQAEAAEAGAAEYSIVVSMANADGDPQNVSPIDHWTCDIADGVGYYEFVVPPGTSTGAQVPRLTVTARVETGTMKLRIGQVQIENLTTIP